MGIFSNQRRYFSKDGLRGEGPKAIVAALDAVGKSLVETNDDLGVAYEEMSYSGDRSDPKCRHGEKCLVLLNPDREVNSIIFASIDGQGKINKLHTGMILRKKRVSCALVIIEAEATG